MRLPAKKILGIVLLIAGILMSSHALSTTVQILCRHRSYNAHPNLNRTLES
jgi:hypothetical protein